MNPSSTQRTCLGCLLLPVFLMACGGPEREPRGGQGISNPAPSQTSSPNDPPANTPDCTPGDTRPCKNTIKGPTGVIACVEGIEECTADGHWSACRASLTGDPEASEPGGAQGSDQGQMQLTSLGAQQCTNNACDAACQVFPEDDGVSTTQSVGGGGLGSALPTSFQNTGLKDSQHPPHYTACSTQADCQFDHHCLSGVCEPWAAGQYDASSTKPDYTLKVPCSGGGIEVCNRGAV